MLHRDVDRFDVREGKWIKWYESHLCMYIKSRGELGRKFGIEFVKGMKVCRKKKKKKGIFLPCFRLSKLRCKRVTWKICFSSGWESGPRLCFIAFLPISSRVSLGNVWSSCFPHSRENLTESRGILIRARSHLVLDRFSLLGSRVKWSYIYIFSKRENHRRGRKLFREIIQIYRIDIWERNKFLRFIYSFFFIIIFSGFIGFN